MTISYNIGLIKISKDLLNKKWKNKIDNLIVKENRYLTDILLL